jgi:hypothetical protein
MTQEPGPTPVPAAEAVFRRALRDVAVLLAVLLVVGLVVGGLVAGSAGVWGALLGWGLAAVFSTTTIVAMIRTARSTPAAMAGLVMGTWLAKVLVIIVVLAVLRPLDFYSKPILGAMLALAVIGSAVLDYRAVSMGRVPYVEPGQRD